MGGGLGRSSGGVGMSLNLFSDLDGAPDSIIYADTPRSPVRMGGRMGGNPFVSGDYPYRTIKGSVSKTKSKVLLRGDGATPLPGSPDARPALQWKSTGQLDPPNVVHDRVNTPFRNKSNFKLGGSSPLPFVKTTNGALMPAPELSPVRGRLQWERTKSSVPMSHKGDQRSYLTSNQKYAEQAATMRTHTKAAAKNVGKVLAHGSVNKCASLVHLGGAPPTLKQAKLEGDDPMGCPLHAHLSPRLGWSLPPGMDDISQFDEGIDELTQSGSDFNPWKTTSSDRYPAPGPGMLPKPQLPVRTFSQYELGGSGVVGSKLYTKEGALTPRGVGGSRSKYRTTYMDEAVHPSNHKLYGGPKQPHEYKRFQWYRMHSNVLITDRCP